MQKKKLVFIGGGHAHALALLDVIQQERLPDHVDAVLISRTAWTPYSGMLPGLIAGHYSLEETHIHLPSLCAAAGVEWIENRVEGMDLTKRAVFTSSHDPLEYDLLSIDIGSTPVIDPTPGAREHAIPVKPVDRFLVKWRTVLERVRRQSSEGSDSTEPFRIVVVGSGAGGVEALLSMQYQIENHQSASAAQVDFTLVSQSDAPLPTHPKAAQRFFRRLLERKGVQLRFRSRVKQVESGRLLTESGSPIPFDALFWLTQAGPQPWVEGSGIAVDDRGFIAVNPYLQSTSHQEIFATGDIASMTASPRAKAGVYAVRQAPYLIHNLRARMAGKPLKIYQPQNDFLTLISAGEKYALGAKYGWAFRGRWVWKWKDHIDRKFMQPFHEIQEKAGVESVKN